MKDFWKMLGIFGSISSIIGIGLAFYFFNLTKEDKEPFFLNSPIKTRIINSKLIEDAPFEILRKNGEKISEDVTSSIFYFWNQGKKPIKNEQILDSIVIALPDQIEILSYQILSESRQVCDFKLIKIDKKSIKLEFKIIEELDGFIGQIIFLGNPNATPTIKGNIEGVKKFNIENIKYGFFTQIIISILIGIITYFFVTILIFGLVKFITRNDEVSLKGLIKRDFTDKRSLIMNISFAILISVSSFLALKSNKNFSNNIDTTIPIEIKNIETNATTTIINPKD